MLFGHIWYKTLLKVYPWGNSGRVREEKHKIVLTNSFVLSFSSSSHTSKARLSIHFFSPEKNVIQSYALSLLGKVGT
jgi:hypothetical protein